MRLCTDQHKVTQRLTTFLFGNEKADARNGALIDFCIEAVMFENRNEKGHPTVFLIAEILHRISYRALLLG